MHCPPAPFTRDVLAGGGLTARSLSLLRFLHTPRDDSDPYHNHRFLCNTPPPFPTPSDLPDLSTSHPPPYPLAFLASPPPPQDTLPEGAGPDEPFHHSLRSLPNPCSLRDALSSRLDLRAPLRRPVLRALSECCQDPAERAWMELLCAKTSGGENREQKKRGRYKELKDFLSGGGGRDGDGDGDGEGLCSVVLDFV